MKKFYVYILASKRHGTLYTGFSKNIFNRTEQHKLSSGSKFTDKYNVKNLVYYEEFEDFDRALQREKQIKKWKRQWKIEMIEKFNPEWEDLSGINSQNERPLQLDSCLRRKDEARETRIKKLLYRSWYRGCKETDKIVGGYAKKYIENFSDKELDELEEILNKNDNDIYDWLSNKKEMPEDMKINSVMQKLKDFIPANEV